MNRLVSTLSSALTSQKSEKIAKRLLSLNIARIRFWIRTNVYYIPLDQIARFDSFFDKCDPSLTLDDFELPDLTSNNLNFNPQQNSESKRMYIEYISTKPPPPF